jgi:hypothetical protein
VPQDVPGSQVLSSSMLPLPAGREWSNVVGKKLSKKSLPVSIDVSKSKCQQEAQDGV